MNRVQLRSGCFRIQLPYAWTKTIDITCKDIIFAKINLPQSDQYRARTRPAWDLPVGLFALCLCVFVLVCCGVEQSSCSSPFNTSVISCVPHPSLHRKHTSRPYLRESHRWINCTKPGWSILIVRCRQRRPPQNARTNRCQRVPRWVARGLQFTDHIVVCHADARVSSDHC